MPARGVEYTVVNGSVLYEHGNVLEQALAALQADAGLVDCPLATPIAIAHATAARSQVLIAHDLRTAEDSLPGRGHKAPAIS